jgi:hypothetical protein
MPFGTFRQFRPHEWCHGETILDQHGYPQRASAWVEFAEMLTGRPVADRSTTKTARNALQRIRQTEFDAPVEPLPRSEPVQVRAHVDRGMPAIEWSHEIRRWDAVNWQYVPVAQQQTWMLR